MFVLSLFGLLALAGTSVNYVHANDANAKCEFFLADIYFLYDKSGSIGSHERFNKMTTFSTKILTHLEKKAKYGINGLNVGWGSFGSNFNPAQGSNTHGALWRKSDPKNDIIREYYNNMGGTALGNAMTYINKYVFTNNRPGATKILFIFTDGAANSYHAVTTAYAQLRNSNVMVFSVGIGNLNINGLKNIVGGDKNRVLKVADFNSLDNLATLKSAVNKLCEGACEWQKPAFGTCTASCFPFPRLAQPKIVTGEQRATITMIDPRQLCKNLNSKPRTVTNPCTRTCKATCIRRPTNCKIEDSTRCHSPPWRPCTKCDPGYEVVNHMCVPKKCSEIKFGIVSATGTDVISGCTCPAGHYGGRIQRDPNNDYSRACTKCTRKPPNCITEDNVNCFDKNTKKCIICEAGYKVNALTGKCEKVPCPQIDFIIPGSTIAGPGCKCQNGYKNTIQPVVGGRYYKGQCSPIECASLGVSVATGGNVHSDCTCNSAKGYKMKLGKIKAVEAKENGATNNCEKCQVDSSQTKCHTFDKNTCTATNKQECKKCKAGYILENNVCKEVGCPKGTENHGRENVSDTPGIAGTEACGGCDSLRGYDTTTHVKKAFYTGFSGGCGKCPSRVINNCTKIAEECVNGRLMCEKCDTGYKVSSGDCIDIDECTAANPCKNGRHCVNNEGGYVCGNCPEDYQKNDGLHGCKECKDIIANCDTHKKECTVTNKTDDSDMSNSCSGGCKKGYEWRNNKCEDVNECKPLLNPCKDGRQCENEIGNFYCEPCTGHEVDLNATHCKKCAKVPNCKTEGAGCDANDNIVCDICEEGYKKVGNECKDINECTEGVDGDTSNKACRGNRKCVNNIGIKVDQPGFKCESCTGAFANDGDRDCKACSDPIVKDTGCAEYSERCVDVGNGIEKFCGKCKPGFKIDLGTNRCVDVNECEDPTLKMKCHEKRTCENTPGSYDCLDCELGYINNGEYSCSKCEYNDEHCQEFHPCLLNNTKPSCSTCNPGYVADPNGVCKEDTKNEPEAVNVDAPDKKSNSVAAIAGGAAAGAAALVGAGLIGYKVYNMKQAVDLLEAEKNAYLGAGDAGSNPMFNSGEQLVENAMASST
eukprot:Pgem_evm1s7367